MRPLGLNGATESRAALPLVEMEAAVHGRVGTSGERYADAAVGARLRYEHHGGEAGHPAIWQSICMAPRPICG
ncbi:hypothetical protein C3488_13025 [Streptomyces sp. Ru72]|nr:hypothetical protein C3488_13025 [Streptomyces sp. Ru72]